MSETEDASTKVELEALRALQADASELEHIQNLLDRFNVPETHVRTVVGYTASGCGPEGRGFEPRRSPVRKAREDGEENPKARVLALSSNPCCCNPHCDPGSAVRQTLA